jgi:hypothetical protein
MVAEFRTSCNFIADPRHARGLLSGPGFVAGAEFGQRGHLHCSVRGVWCGTDQLTRPANDTRRNHDGILS